MTSTSSQSNPQQLFQGLAQTNNKFTHAVPLWSERLCKTQLQHRLVANFQSDSRTKTQDSASNTYTISTYNPWPEALLKPRNPPPTPFPLAIKFRQTITQAPSQSNPSFSRGDKRSSHIHISRLNPKLDTSKKNNVIQLLQLQFSAMWCASVPPHLY
ncbi:hypothetical protein P171DRAFT_182169 [Karstenula rhodostoma CBS 690.94]|uniref:Uncharacterized protein n=1 Tax=Karstenula rhodostoma CBS 690.94 TaxID=1392251 RepID=A0A9P4P4Z0_9PLEO|nr:hypothetical protein P171DRAFT_182169 [Karstenula rhodostoma CBS 690.94]